MTNAHPHMKASGDHFCVVCNVFIPSTRVSVVGRTEDHLVLVSVRAVFDNRAHLTNHKYSCLGDLIVDACPSVPNVSFKWIKSVSSLDIPFSTTPVSAMNAASTLLRWVECYVDTIRDGKQQSSLT